MNRKAEKTITLDDKQRDKINDLIVLDYDAVEAYEAAINRLDSTELRKGLAAFKGDHERHIRELSALISRSGGDPPSGPDYKAILTQGKVVLGQIAGDKGILAAMLTNEVQTNGAYEKALGDPLLSTDAGLRELLARNLEDERRHKAWIEGQVKRAS